MTVPVPCSGKTLPAGWSWMELGEVCEIIAGQSPPGSTYRSTPDGLPFFQGKADFGKTNPVARIWCVEPRKIAQPGDILISVRAPVGPTNVADVACCIGRGLSAIRCRENADRDFILCALRHFESMLVKKGSGSTFEAINRDDLESFEIPLPPLDEQRRISGVLREQMATVEKARAAAQARLAAVEALPASILREAFSPAWVERWGSTTVNEIASLVIDGPHVTPSYVQQGVPFVTVKNIQSGCLNFRDLSYITEEDHRQFCRRGCAERGDILYTKDGTLGIPCVIDTDKKFSFFVSVALIKLRREVADPEFIAYAMRSRYVLNQVDRLGAGAGLKHMVLRSIRSLVIPCPSLEEQRRIAGVLREQMATAGKAYAAADEELSTINVLPAALLRRAFNGDL